MDNRIISNKAQSDEVQFWRMMMQINTSIPAVVEYFDPEKKRVSATPSIRAKVVIDDEVKYIPYPLITNIPLVLVHGGGFYITHPLKKGDSCTLIFSQRSIDNFMITGVQSNPFDDGDTSTTQLRCFDITDAMCFPGIICDANTLPEYSTESIDVRNKDNTSRISLFNEKIEIINNQDEITIGQNKIDIKTKDTNITTPTTISIDTGVATVKASSLQIDAATTTINGSLVLNGSFSGSVGVTMANGNLVATQGVTSGIIPFNSHVHGGVQSGDKQTGAPQ